MIEYIPVLFVVCSLGTFDLGKKKLRAAFILLFGAEPELRK
jgi:hypothetical protein